MQYTTEKKLRSERKERFFKTRLLAEMRAKTEQSEAMLKVGPIASVLTRVWRDDCPPLTRGCRMSVLY